MMCKCANERTPAKLAIYNGTVTIRFHRGLYLNYLVFYKVYI